MVDRLGEQVVAPLLQLAGAHSGARQASMVSRVRELAHAHTYQVTTARHGLTVLSLGYMHVLPVGKTGRSSRLMTSTSHVLLWKCCEVARLLRALVGCTRTLPEVERRLLDEVTGIRTVS